MQKNKFFIIVILLIFLSNLFITRSGSEESSGVTYAREFEDGTFFEGDDRDSVERQKAYIEGVRQTVRHFAVPVIDKHFPDFTAEEILEMVKAYYRNAPDRIDRPAIEVMISGGEEINRFNLMTTKMETEEYLNGFYLLSEQIDPLAQIMYIQGLCDGIARVDMATMRKYYRTMDYPDIWDELMLYYEAQPLKRERPVVETILTGMGREPHEDEYDDKILTFDQR